MIIDIHLAFQLSFLAAQYLFIELVDRNWILGCPCETAISVVEMRIASRFWNGWLEICFGWPVWALLRLVWSPWLVFVFRIGNVVLKTPLVLIVWILLILEVLFYRIHAWTWVCTWFHHVSPLEVLYWVWVTFIRARRMREAFLPLRMVKLHSSFWNFAIHHKPLVMWLSGIWLLYGRLYCIHVLVFIWTLVSV